MKATSIWQAVDGRGKTLIGNEESTRLKLKYETIIDVVQWGLLFSTSQSVN
jgi:hypothetical protein